MAAGVQAAQGRAWLDQGLLSVCMATSDDIRWHAPASAAAGSVGGLMTAPTTDMHARQHVSLTGAVQSLQASMWPSTAPVTTADECCGQNLKAHDRSWMGRLRLRSSEVKT